MSRIFDNLPSSKASSAHLNIGSSIFGNDGNLQMPMFMENTASTSSFRDFLQNQPTSLEEKKVHKLAYEWSFWQHFRLNVNANGSTTGDEIDGETSTNGDGSSVLSEDPNVTSTDSANTTVTTESSVSKKGTKPNIRDTQYIQDTTVLSFPRVFGNPGEQTEVIDSVEQFWESFVNMQNVEDVAEETEYFFFKKGIKPLWEDELNKNGGRWSLNFSNPHHKFKKLPLCIFWEMLLLKIASGKLLDDDISIPLSKEVLSNPEFENITCKKKVSNAELNKMIMDDLAGVTISIRNKKIIVSIWNTNLAYEEYKTANGVSVAIPNEDYYYTFREKLKFKSKQLYEEIGLTIYQFRHLIFHSVNKILNEAFDFVRDDDVYKDMSKVYNRQIFKYVPHFSESTTPDVKKNKYGNNEITKGKRAGGNGNNNGGSNGSGHADWFKARANVNGIAGSGGNGHFGNGHGNGGANSNSGSSTEKFSRLGQVRKKVEFNDKGLVVEELNIMRLRG